MDVPPDPIKFLEQLIEAPTKIEILNAFNNYCITLGKKDIDDIYNQFFAKCQEQNISDVVLLAKMKLFFKIDFELNLKTQVVPDYTIQNVFLNYQQIFPQTIYFILESVYNYSTMKNEAGKPLLMMLDANESRYVPVFSQQFVELTVQNSFMGMSYIYSNYHRQFMQALIMKYRNYFQNKSLVDAYCNNVLDESMEEKNKIYGKILFSCPRQIKNKMNNYEDIYQDNMRKLTNMYRSATSLFKDIDPKNKSASESQGDGLGDAPVSNKIRYMIVRAHEEQSNMIQQLIRFTIEEGFEIKAYANMNCDRLAAPADRDKTMMILKKKYNVVDSYVFGEDQVKDSIIKDKNGQLLVINKKHNPIIFEQISTECRQVFKQLFSSEANMTNADAQKIMQNQNEMMYSFLKSGQRFDDVILNKQCMTKGDHMSFNVTDIFQSAKAVFTQQKKEFKQNLNFFEQMDQIKTSEKRLVICSQFIDFVIVIDVVKVKKLVLDIQGQALDDNNDEQFNNCDERYSLKEFFMFKGVNVQQAKTAEVAESETAKNMNQMQQNIQDVIGFLKESHSVSNPKNPLNIEQNRAWLKSALETQGIESVTKQLLSHVNIEKAPTPVYFINIKQLTVRDDFHSFLFVLGYFLQNQNHIKDQSFACKSKRQRDLAAMVIDGIQKEQEHALLESHMILGVTFGATNIQQSQPKWYDTFAQYYLTAFYSNYERHESQTYTVCMYNKKQIMDDFQFGLLIAMASKPDLCSENGELLVGQQYLQIKHNDAIMDVVKINGVYYVRGKPSNFSNDTDVEVFADYVYEKIANDMEQKDIGHLEQVPALKNIKKFEGQDKTYQFDIDGKIISFKYSKYFYYFAGEKTRAEDNLNAKLDKLKSIHPQQSKKSYRDKIDMNLIKKERFSFLKGINDILFEPDFLEQIKNFLKVQKLIYRFWLIVAQMDAPSDAPKSALDLDADTFKLDSQEYFPSDEARDYSLRRGAQPTGDDVIQKYEFYDAFAIISKKIKDYDDIFNIGCFFDIKIKKSDVILQKKSLVENLVNVLSKGPADKYVRNFERNSEGDIEGGKFLLYLVQLYCYLQQLIFQHFKPWIKQDLSFSKVVNHYLTDAHGKQNNYTPGQLGSHGSQFKKAYGPSVMPGFGEAVDYAKYATPDFSQYDASFVTEGEENIQEEAFNNTRGRLQQLLFYLGIHICDDTAEIQNIVTHPDSFENQSLQLHIVNSAQSQRRVAYLRWRDELSVSSGGESGISDSIVTSLNNLHARQSLMYYELMSIYANARLFSDFFQKKHEELQHIFDALERQNVVDADEIDGIKKLLKAKKVKQEAKKDSIYELFLDQKEEYDVRVPHYFDNVINLIGENIKVERHNNLLYLSPKEYSYNLPFDDDELEQIKRKIMELFHIDPSRINDIPAKKKEELLRVKSLQWNIKRWLSQHRVFDGLINNINQESYMKLANHYSIEITQPYVSCDNFNDYLNKSIRIETKNIDAFKRIIKEAPYYKVSPVLGDELSYIFTEWRLNNDAALQSSMTGNEDQDKEEKKMYFSFMYEVALQFFYQNMLNTTFCDLKRTLMMFEDQASDGYIIARTTAPFLENLVAIEPIFGSNFQYMVFLTLMKLRQDADKNPRVKQELAKLVKYNGNDEIFDNIYFQSSQQRAMRKMMNNINDKRDMMSQYQKYIISL